MLRGLFSGIVWGGILGAAFLAVMSFLIPLPSQSVTSETSPESETVEEPAPQPVPVPIEQPVVTPEPEPAPDPAPEPEPEPAPEPEPEEEAAAPVEEPPAAEVASEPEPAPEPEAEIIAEPEATTEAPESADAPAMGTDVAAAIPDPAPEPQPETAAAPEPIIPAEPEPAPAEEIAVVEPEPEPAPEPMPAPEPEPAEEAAPPMPEPEPEMVAEEPAPEPEIIPEPEVAEAPVEEPAPVEMPEPAEEEVASIDPPEAETTAPSGIGQPVVGFGNRASDVRINRLPTIGGETATAEEPAEDVAEEPAGDVPALDRYAASFENAGGKPLFSVVLIDVGESDGGLATSALTTFPFPVTFAIPADRADAEDVAKAYRAAGFEVILMASGIPAGATPTDLETTFGYYRTTIPEAVAVMDTPEGGFQNDRRQAQQVVSILSEEGLGLLSFNKGLNAAERIANRESLPSATVFREIDPAGDDAEAIRRSLDRSAFRATQEGAVIVLGTTRNETISALFSWVLEGNAEQLALAPVSAAFRAQ